MYFNTDKGNCQETIQKIILSLQEKKIIQSSEAQDVVQALKMCNHFTTLKAERIVNCGSFIALNRKGEITGANFCRNKLCPVCQWRNSRQQFGKIFELQKAIESDVNDFEYIFTTFTILNVKSLSEGVQAVLKGFNNLTHDRVFRKVNKGFIRTLEITYKADTAEWHPHVHMIMAVPEDYFTNEKLYLAQQEWTALWKRAARLDYTPIVDVRKVSENRAQAIAEIAKYAVKPFDIQRAQGNKINVYAELMQSTYNRRLRSLSGIYKQKAKELNIDIENDKEFAEFSQNDITFKFINNKYVEVKLDEY